MNTPLVSSIVGVNRQTIMNHFVEIVPMSLLSYQSNANTMYLAIKKIAQSSWHGVSPNKKLIFT
jgi:hypothetical protein